MSLTCSGDSHECLGTFTHFPSLYIVKMDIATYTAHGSFRRWRMPILLSSLRTSSAPSATDRSRGPLIFLLLVCVVNCTGTYGGVLQQIHLVVVVGVFPPDLLLHVRDFENRVLAVASQGLCLMLIS